MELETILSELASFGATMRECLAALDGAAPEDPLVGRAFDQLQERFQALGDLVELRRGLAGDDLERVDDALEELCRLNAVLVSSVVRDKERLLGELKRVQAARSSFRGVPPGNTTGASCDVNA